MKKTKIVSLFLVVVMLLAAFTACGGAADIKSASSYKSIYSNKYVPEDEIYNNAKAIRELEGFKVVESSEEFVLLASGEAATLTYKVYSYASETVVKTLTSSVSAVYTVKLCGDMPAFFVTKASVKDVVTPTPEGGEGTGEGEGAGQPAAQAEGAAEGDATGDAGSEGSSTPTVDLDNLVTYSLYDANGKEIATSKDNVGAPVVIGETLIYDSVVYTPNKDGVLEAEEDKIPENLKIVDFDLYNEDYLYDMGNSTISVYDLRFNPVSSWTAPSYAKDLGMFVLNNGNILVQYTNQLEADASVYDFYKTAEDGAVSKFDLVSLVVSAKDGSAKSVELNFVIDDMLVYNTDIAPYGEDSVFSKKMGNLAFISPISGGKIDTSDEASDVVILSDDCKSAKSIKIANQQTASLPEKLNKSTYMVETVYGSAVVKANGNVIYALTNDGMTANADYIIGEKAIYDIKSFDVVYDLEEEKAHVVEVMNNAVFILKGDEATKYTIEMLLDDEVKELCSYDVAAAKGKTFHAVDGFGCYALFDVAKAEYTYYTLNGDVITTSKYKLEILAYSEKYDTLILAEEATGLGYNALTYDAEKAKKSKK